MGKLTSVTPVIIFWMRDLRVLTAGEVLVLPNHMRILRYLPYLFLVFCFIT